MEAAHCAVEAVVVVWHYTVQYRGRVRELQPHYIAVYGIGSLTSRSTASASRPVLASKRGRLHTRRPYRPTALYIPTVYVSHREDTRTMAYDGRQASRTGQCTLYQAAVKWLNAPFDDD